MANYNIVNDDCLEILPEIPNNSVDMVLADLPYGTTACDWDSIIPLEPLWEQYKRIGKDDTPYVFTASQPFTTKLTQSNMDWFKYDLVWDKELKSGFLNANRMPLRRHEDILLFYKELPTYNPQKYKGEANHSKGSLDKDLENNNYGSFDLVDNKNELGEEKYPDTLLKYQKDHPSKTVHPTQKPVALLVYLIKTYTNEGDLVLDNVMGSGTTGVACQKTDRRFLGIEKNEEYFEIAQERIEEAKNTDWERVEGIEEWQEFDGIGEKTATTLYDELGRVEEADMEQLESVDGIGSKTADKIREEIN